MMPLMSVHSLARARGCARPVSTTACSGWAVGTAVVQLILSNGQSGAFVLVTVEYRLHSETPIG